jgi:hypothetical protein
MPKQPDKSSNTPVPPSIHDNENLQAEQEEFDAQLAKVPPPKLAEFIEKLSTLKPAERPPPDTP